MTRELKIEEILASEKVGRSTYYLIKFAGSRLEDASWLVKSNLSKAQQEIEKFKKDPYIRRLKKTIRSEKGRASVIAATEYETIKQLVREFRSKNQSKPPTIIGEHQVTMYLIKIDGQITKMDEEEVKKKYPRELASWLLKRK